MELNQFVNAFSEFESGRYNPQLAIIVGQKRHQTRFFRDVPTDEQVGSGKGAAKGGKGNKGGKGDGVQGKGGKGGKTGKGSKGSNGDEAQVEPGTVAGEGIAQPGHLNFFLVAHQGIKGTSVPCHYHVLHLDARLLKQVGIDDIERITFELCHLYSRADKAVSYAAPTYLADHLCERGKLYLETKFADDAYEKESLSTDSEELLRQEIDNRVKWFNVELQKGHEQQQAGHLQGLNYFC
jgi:hypothetical protein